MALEQLPRHGGLGPSRVLLLQHRWFEHAVVLHPSVVPNAATQTVSGGRGQTGCRASADAAARNAQVGGTKSALGMRFVTSYTAARSSNMVGAAVVTV